MQLYNLHICPCQDWIHPHGHWAAGHPHASESPASPPLSLSPCSFGRGAFFKNCTGKLWTMYEPGGGVRGVLGWIRKVSSRLLRNRRNYKTVTWRTRGTKQPFRCLGISGLSIYSSYQQEWSPLPGAPLPPTSFFGWSTLSLSLVFFLWFVAFPVVTRLWLNNVPGASVNLGS